jgi:hypothetical protein
MGALRWHGIGSDLLNEDIYPRYINSFGSARYVVAKLKSLQ